MPKAPRGERLILTLTGRRNAGKSSLINALVGQEIAIVSETPGTTTDPVPKSYELLPLGPVTFYDTAGIDDVGELGKKRIQRTRKILFRTDIAILVVGNDGLQKEDLELITEIQNLKIPFILVFNKIDLSAPQEKDLNFARQQGLRFCRVSATENQGVTELKEMLVNLAPDFLKAEKVLVGDLIFPGDVVLLVAPIDTAAPKGRLILPQVQVLREILDNDAVGMIVKEREIEAAFERLHRVPDLVITDSQVVLKVVGDVPPEVKLTTFSILFARYKGDLEELVKGARQIDKLQNGDKILIAETCSHNVQCDDIGRVKIPRWLTQYTGKQLDYEVVGGDDFPDDLEKYQLIIHCGGCMITPTAMMRRITEAKRRGVPITNYGVAISKVQGVLERTLEPFGM
ncbi:MAG TPA: [FeFe] hydrogenase H-cluster maturation GTPase HydF [Candidatus Cloacimonadota bacterium]|nr:[FeFe] hydrogenase H-cluster maturation GTPase HydF [Candidatus Cloacimonadota bacterium]